MRWWTCRNSALRIEDDVEQRYKYVVEVQLTSTDDLISPLGQLSYVVF